MTRDVAEFLCDGKGLEHLTKLLDAGFPVGDANGSPLVRAVLERVDWGIVVAQVEPLLRQPRVRLQRITGARQGLHLLVERGGRWVPRDAGEIGDVRKRLLKMKPEYTAEVVLIMTRHRGCEKTTLEALLRTPDMKKHVAKLESRIARLLASWQ